MKIYLFLGILLIGVFLYSGCKNKTIPGGGNTLSDIPIDLTDLENKLSLDEYIDSVTFIPLETTDHSLIQHISGLVVREHKIYVRDELQGCILVFDEEGKYLFKINRLGRGPDEYTHLMGFTVDLQHIIILGLSEVVLYDKDNGDFVKKICINPKDFVPVKIYADSSSYYFQSADGFADNRMQATILVFDKEFVFNRGYVDPFYFKGRPYATSGTFIDSPYGLLYHEALNDTIYRLEDSARLKPLFFLNAGKYQFTHDMYEQLPSSSDGGREVPYKAIYPIDGVFCTDRFLGFTCYQKKNNRESDVFWCFYSLKDGKMRIFNQEKISENSKYGTQFLAFHTKDKQGYFYSVRIPSLIMYQRERGVVLDKRLDAMQEGDNPWLMKYWLKD